MDTQKKEVILAFRHLLKLLKIHVSFSNLDEYWQAHPDYLSMVFFSDACKKYNIDCVALEPSTSDFGKNGFPFIAHLVDNGGHFVVVKEIDEIAGKISYYQPFKGCVKIPLKVFFDRYGGAVFYALPNEQSGEVDYLSKRVKELIHQACHPLFWITLFMLFVSSLYLLHPTLTNVSTLLLAIKVIGLFVCINLLYHELIGENRISQTICNSNKYTSCDDVLQSPASQIWGIHMSDLGFVYFSGGIVSLICSLFLNIQPVTLSLLLILTLFSIPYAVFSVCYQLFAIRKICPFCMSVIFALLLEWILVFFHLDKIKLECLLSWQIIFPIGCMLLMFSGWIITKPVIQKAKDGYIFKYKYLRLKKNPQIFNSSLEKEQSVNMEIIMTELIIGNPKATTTITIVMNTKCAPCARMHRQIHSILEEYGSEIRVIVRFMLTYNNMKETLFFIRLYYSKGTLAFSSALHDWFENRNYNHLVQEYSEIQEYALEDELILHWTTWYDKTKISGTPTVFLNDKKIEQEYDIDDIRWLVQNSLYNESK